MRPLGMARYAFDTQRHSNRLPEHSNCFPKTIERQQIRPIMSGMKPILVAAAILCAAFAGDAQINPKQCTKLKLVASSPMTREGLPLEVAVKKDDGGDIDGATVIWTISSGRIVEGDGTPHAVLVPKLVEDEVSSKFVVTAKVSNFPNLCNPVLSDSYGVDVIADPDFWPKLTDIGVMASLDNLYINLDRNPAYEALVVIRFSENASRAYKTSRLRLFYRHIKYRGYDLSRLSIFVGDDDQTENTMAILTKNVNKIGPPLIDPSKVLRAEEIPFKLKTMFTKSRGTLK